MFCARALSLCSRMFCTCIYVVVYKQIFDALILLVLEVQNLGVFSALLPLSTSLSLRYAKGGVVNVARIRGKRH